MCSATPEFSFSLHPANSAEIATLEAWLPVKDKVFHHRWLVSQQSEGNLDYVIAWSSSTPIGRGVILWHGYVIPELMEEFPDTPVIRSVEVAEKYRRLGVGTAIVRELEGRAVKRGYKSVSLGVMSDNKNALQLWQNLGYEDWGKGIFTAVSRYEETVGDVNFRKEVFLPMRKNIGLGAA